MLALNWRDGSYLLATSRCSPTGSIRDLRTAVVMCCEEPTTDLLVHYLLDRDASKEIFKLSEGGWKDDEHTVSEETLC